MFNSISLYVLENHEGETTLEKYHAKVHKCLADVLFHLKEVIHRFPSMKTNEILNAAGILIRNVKNLSHVDRKNPDEFNEVIDQLALIFSSRCVCFLTSYNNCASFSFLAFAHALLSFNIFKNVCDYVRTFVLIIGFIRFCTLSFCQNIWSALHYLSWRFILYDLIFSTVH